MVFREAFTTHSALGFGIFTAIRYGLARGLYSNEAGYGTAGVAYGTAQSTHPVQQGLNAVMEVIIVSFGTCTLTAMTVMLSGVIDWTAPAAQRATSTAAVGLAFDAAMPGIGGYLVAFCVFLFGYGTLIGWAYYGEQFLEYWLGPRVVMPYRWVYCLLDPARRDRESESRLGLGRSDERAADLPEPRRRGRPERDCRDGRARPEHDDEGTAGAVRWPRGFPSIRRSSRCSQSSRTSSRRAARSCTSRSGTASARSCFAAAADVFIQSRDLRPLDRYFPELHDALLTALPDGCVVDGEIVIATGRGLDFDALQLRLHPAASRVAKLAKETPAAFVAFDVLAADGQDLRGHAAARAPRAARAAAGEGRSADPPDADDARPRRSRRNGCRGSRARASTASIAKPEHGAVSARQARDDQGQARAHRRLRRRRIPLAQGRAERSWSARCCSGCMTTRGGCITSA